MSYAFSTILILAKIAFDSCSVTPSIFLLQCIFRQYMDVLMQKTRISCLLAMELRLFCIKSSIWPDAISWKLRGSMPERCPAIAYALDLYVSSLDQQSADCDFFKLHNQKEEFLVGHYKG